MKAPEEHIRAIEAMATTDTEEDTDTEDIEQAMRLHQRPPAQTRNNWTEVSTLFYILKWFLDSNSLYYLEYSEQDAGRRGEYEYQSRAAP